MPDKESEKMKKKKTYQTNKTPLMPLGPQRPNHHLRHRFPTLPALGAVAMGMTPDTPSIIVLFDKRGGSVKGVAASGAEEMPFVVGVAAGDDDLVLDGGLTGFAAGGEELVVVEVAVEAGGEVVDAIGDEFEVGHFRRGGGFRGRRWGEAGLAGVDAGQAVVPLGRGFPNA